MTASIGSKAEVRGRFYPKQLAMEALLKSEEGARFIGTIERFLEGWRASYRLRRLTDVFTEQGDTEFFSTELQATKWLHTQATARGFSSIEFRRQS